MLKYKLIILLLLIIPIAAKSQLQINPGEYPNSYDTLFARRQQVESALTLLENKNQLIPLKALDTLRIAALSVGSSTLTPFQKMAGNYTKVDYFNLPEDFKDVQINELVPKLKKYNLVITGIHSLYESRDRRTVKPGNPIHEAPPRPYGVTDNLEKLLGQLSLLKNSLLVFFSNPDAINEIKDIGHPAGLVIAYQNRVINQELAAQMLFGGIGANGKLPVSIGSRYQAGDGLTISEPIRLKYTLPEEVGLNSGKLNRRIDSIVNNALAQKAFPGCNVLIAKDGKVIFQKAYGFHTYENRIVSSLDDIYDLASVTKVAGALPAIMKLNGEEKYLLDVPFQPTGTTGKKDFCIHPIKAILHCANSLHISRDWFLLFRSTSNR